MDRDALSAARALIEERLSLKQRQSARAETAIVLGNLALIAWFQRDLGRTIKLLKKEQGHLKPDLEIAARRYLMEAR